MQRRGSQPGEPVDNKGGVMQQNIANGDQGKEEHSGYVQGEQGRTTVQTSKPQDISMYLQRPMGGRHLSP